MAGNFSASCTKYWLMREHRGILSTVKARRVNSVTKLLVFDWTSYKWFEYLQSTAHPTDTLMEFLTNTHNWGRPSMATIIAFYLLPQLIPCGILEIWRCCSYNNNNNNKCMHVCLYLQMNEWMNESVCLPICLYICMDMCLIDCGDLETKVRVAVVLLF